MYTDLIRFEKKTVSVLVPSHVGITGNSSAAESAHRNALDGDIPDECMYIPFSNLKFHVDNYVTKLWQSE